MVFNPGTDRAARAAKDNDVFPVARFSFFLDSGGPDAAPVPTIYAAFTENVALWETILRDREPADHEPVAYAVFAGRVLARVTTVRALHVASLAGADMHRFDLPADELTFADVGQYAETIPWPRAAWAAGHGGVKYVSRRDPSGLAHVFFENVARGRMFREPVPEDYLQSFEDMSPGGGFEWLAARLARWNINGHCLT